MELEVQADQVVLAETAALEGLVVQADLEVQVVLEEQADLVVQVGLADQEDLVEAAAAVVQEHIPTVKGLILMPWLAEAVEQVFQVVQQELVNLAQTLRLQELQTLAELVVL